MSRRVSLFRIVFALSFAAALCVVAPARAQSSIQIVSPAPGTVVSPGSTLTVTVNTTGTYQAMWIAGPDPLNFSQVLTVPPYTFSLPIPARTPAKTYVLTAVGVAGPNQGDESPSITIDIEPPDAPGNITVQPEILVLTYPGEVASLLVRGDFAASAGINITYSTQTTYSSDSPSVATVDRYGRVTAMGPGSGSITVTNGGVPQVVPVTVLNPVTVGPQWAVLYAGQTQRFHGTAANPGGDSTVMWSIAPEGAGSIDSTGIYTAPASIDTKQIVTITATSTALGLSNSVQVWLYPPLSVNVVPASISRGPSESIRFVAAAINPPSVAVQWSLDPPGLGSIDSSGQYTAPDVIGSTQTVTVIAQTMTNPPITARATVTLTPAVEYISTPDIPNGPETGITGALYQYSAAGAVSSAGHTVQYSFDWGDGTHSGWTPPSVTSSFHAWPTPGTYQVRVIASSVVDQTVLSMPSDALSVTIGGETISAPTIPAGPTDAITGTSYTYSTGGSVSSAGHAVQYRLYWGDGSYSPWLPVGTTSASHTWMGSGGYPVTAQARCAVDTQVQSTISDALQVNVAAGETISPPDAASGPASGTAGTSYTYTASGGSSSSGSQLVYLFDWGDGHTSGWLAPGRTTASHKWSAPGTYVVTVSAADAGDLLIQSAASEGLTVTMQ